MIPEFAHVSVMEEEAVRLLDPHPGGLYVDATVGGGGHALRILEKSFPNSRLIGVDRDPDALVAAGQRLASERDRVTLVHGRLGDLPAILERLGVVAVDGFLVDLGISSPQVDRAERGFSFRQSGPLDMRMDPTTGETAGELIRRVTLEELGEILIGYGDERFGRRIASAIKRALSEGQIENTTDLAAVVAAALPGRERAERKTDPATKTFQALRIAVNDEIIELERFLDAFPSYLRRGGRIVVIAFHSLEDRLVKNRFRDLARHPGLPADIARAQGIRPDPELELLTPKPIAPSDAEVARNPRARSAKLRAAVRR